MNGSNYTHINLEYLYEVADGDIDFVKEIINDYLNKVPDQFTQMKAAASDGDMEAVKFMAHKMKSSFQFMGVQSLVEFAQQVENASDDTRLEMYKHNNELMSHIVEEVLDELKHKLETL